MTDSDTALPSRPLNGVAAGRGTWSEPTAPGQVEPGGPWIGGMRRRWWLFRPFDLLVRAWPVRRPPRGLLVVRMDGIGDMVLFRRALEAYAAAFGVEREEITVLGCRSWAGIAGSVFAGYRVHVLDEHAFERNPFYRLKEALWVRRQGFAVAVTDMYFRKALTADSLVWLSGAPTTVVSHPYISRTTRAEFTWSLGHSSRVIDTGPYPTHEIVRHFRFVSALAGRTLAPETPALAWRETPPDGCPVTPGRPYVVLNFGSNEPGRRWPLEGFIDLAGRLLDAGFRVAFTGGAGERAARPALRRALNRPGVIDLIGRTGLGGLLDLMRGAALVVSNDTGPAHLAIALGAPTVVIVGGGHFGCFVPYPPEVTPDHVRFVYHVMPCYHCFWRCDKRSDRGASFPCVAAVTTDGVWRAVGDVLAKATEKE